MKGCLIIGNGFKPKKNHISFFQRNGFNNLICADGGAETLRKLNLTPEIIIGDLDSISSSTLRYFKEKCRIHQISRQSDTDVEKCLKYAIGKKYSHSILMGVTGDRLDFSLVNMSLPRKFKNKIKILILHYDNLLIPVADSLKISTTPGEVLSLYGFDSSTYVTSKGLRYEIRNKNLRWGDYESTSNEAKGKYLELQISGGVVYIIRNMKEVRKHGLF